MSVVSRENKGNVAVLSVNYPPVNALSHSVRSGLETGLKDALADDAVAAIVIACEGRTFIAGADITEFGKPMQEPFLPALVNVIEASEKPVVAAMHGTALGGGLEVALGCHYRVAAPGSKVGLPEVHLGILPGAGGTQRLPRIAGVENALDAILSGRHIAVEEAAKWGAIDKLSTSAETLLEEAIAFAREMVAKGPRRIGDMELDASAYGQAFFDGFRKTIAKKTRGYFAPEQCIRAVEAAVSHDVISGMEVERKLFMECMANPQSAALRHVFFAERQVGKIDGISKETPRRAIKKVGVIGAGTMGGGISMNFANAGIPVTILEVQEDALNRGLGVIRKNYERSIKSGKITQEGVEKRMSLLTGTLSYDDLTDCDLVIEAVFEKMEIKKTVFEKLDSVVKQGAILASNTSYLDIDEIASFTKRPEDVIGLHFFSPANVMRLLEIVRGTKTADDVLATAIDLAKTIRKIGVVAGVCHGFIGNRMVGRYGRVAAKSVMLGNSPSEVDAALYGFGMPMGPLTMSDMAGLDIGYMNRQALGRDNYDTDAFDWQDKLVEADRKGLKVGAGIYDYTEGDRTPHPSDFVAKVIDDERARLGLKLKPKSSEELVECAILALVNEGAKILEEGIAARASDIDIVYINGYGFPPYRGGPMHYADAMGLANVRDKIKAFIAEDAEWGSISPLIETLADEGKTFADYDRAKG